MRTILHSDINSCYASIELLHHPELRGRPMAVGGDEAHRHGIILAKSIEAKRCGVTTGETLWQARKKCPDLVVVPPHHDLYRRFCRAVWEIYLRYTDQVEPFGMDEAWLDVTGSRALFGSGMDIAQRIRRQVREELGITVSVGVSFNKVFAKLGSDYRKPDAVTEITPENFRTLVWPLPAGDLLFVGRATARALGRYGIHTIGDVAGTDPAFLRDKLGKQGIALHRYANGEDDAPVSVWGRRPPPKSISNGTTPARDLTCDEDVRIVLYVLAESVARQLRGEGYACQVVQVALKDRNFLQIERQERLTAPTDLAGELSRVGLELIARHHRWPDPIRSISLRACDLVPSEQAAWQLSLYEDGRAREKRARLEAAEDRILRRFGPGSLRRSILDLDPELSGFSVHGNLMHPEQGQKD